MAPILRILMISALIGVTFTGCSRFSRQEMTEETTPSVETEDSEDALAELEDVIRSVRTSLNQAGVETALGEARGAGYDDLQIAEAMGMAWLRAPGRRVMISVTFVRFKNQSITDHSELDDAYEFGRTPPAVREAEAAAAVAAEAAAAAALEAEEEEVVAEAETEEEEPRRRRSRWISWIPGL